MPQTFRPRLHALAAALAVLLGSSALAVAEDPTLLPGDSAIKGHKIEPFRATTETGTHAVTLGKVANRDAINILYQVNMSTGERLVDHIVLDGARSRVELVRRIVDPHFSLRSRAGRLPRARY